MLPSVANNRVLIMGLGVHRGGEAVARYCARHGARVTVTDRKTRAELAQTLTRLRGIRGIRYVLGKHHRADFRNQDIIFRNPAVPRSSPYLAVAQKSGALITNEAAFFLDKVRAPVVGITGTRGKSTATKLIYELLKRAPRTRRIYLAGNITTRGLLSLIDEAGTNDRVVAEFSSFQLEHLPDVRKSPSIAVLTSLSKDHLNRYRSFAEYAAAKKNIFRYQRADDIAVLPDDAETLRRFKPALKSRLYLFSTRKRVQGCYIAHGAIYFAEKGSHPVRIMNTTAIPQSQLPYVENVLAAVTVAMIMRVPLTHIRRVVKRFRGLRYRMEIIGKKGITTIINDSCATSPQAAERAILASQKPIALIAGGVDKKLTFVSLAKIIRQNVAFVILLPGSASTKINAALRKLHYKPIARVQTFHEAVTAAQTHLGAVRTLLFSPAAASFNLFANEFDRGQQFTKAMKKTSR